MALDEMSQRLVARMCTLQIGGTAGWGQASRVTDATIGPLRLCEDISPGPAEAKKFGR